MMRRRLGSKKEPRLSGRKRPRGSEGGGASSPAKAGATKGGKRPAGPRPCPPQPAAAGGQTLALLVRVASPLLTRRLDLRQVQLVRGPLDTDLLVDELLDGIEQERGRLVAQAEGIAPR